LGASDLGSALDAVPALLQGGKGAARVVLVGDGVVTGLTYLACVAHVDWHCAANRRFVPTTCCFRRSMRLRSTRGLRRCRA
jgi:hypothetical protein